MKTVLIVEDEKIIRAGLRSIIERAPNEIETLTIETVLECKNGMEAWELLQNHSVDVVFTDIKMPKMNGMELVEKMKTLPVPPPAIIISGYADFSYARGALRQGVRDYLDKPIEREKVFEILKNLDIELENKRRQLQNDRKLRCHLYRSLILGGWYGFAWESALSKEIDELLFNSYAVVCVSPRLNILNTEIDVCVLHNISGHKVLIVKAEELPNLRQNLLHNSCAGVSRETNDPKCLRTAFLEASAAREYAFVHGNTECYADLPELNSMQSIEDRLLRIIQQLGAAKVNEFCVELENIFYMAQNNKIHPRVFTKSISALPDRIIETCGIFAEEKNNLHRYKKLWLWHNAFTYGQSLQQFMIELFAKWSVEDDLKAKIREAIVYVNKNFHSDINMAVTSNYVSMNYTQFSSMFKKYTGSKFSVFLKNIRLAEGKKLLAVTNMSIAKIAKCSGFQNDKHFIKLFKENFGVTPGEYRKNLWASGRAQGIINNG